MLGALTSDNNTGTDGSPGFHYGEQIVYTDTLSQEYRFTGKEHDPETGNDYFGARYYSSAMGRFLTPDWSATPIPIPYAVMGNPQTLNLYSYVENNPITGTDPDGHAGNEGPGSTGDSNACSGTAACDDAKSDRSDAEQYAAGIEGALQYAASQGVQYSAQQVNAAFQSGTTDKQAPSGQSNSAQNSSTSQPDPSRATIKGYVRGQADAFGIPQPIALATAAQESGFNVHQKGGQGEVGLFQVMPNTTTAKDANGKSFKVDIATAKNDWQYNVRVGMSILRDSYKFAQQHVPNDVARATYAKYNSYGHWYQYTYHRGQVASHVRDWYKHYREFNNE